MRVVKRPRRYIDRRLLAVIRPVLRYSPVRDAYVLRLVGSEVGPVLRENRRTRSRRYFEGPERRTRVA